MTILVIAEHENGVVAPATLNTVAAAVKIGGDIHVLVAGAGIGAGDGAGSASPMAAVALWRERFWTCLRKAWRSASLLKAARCVPPWCGCV